jgi:hypothetical protein
MYAEERRHRTTGADRGRKVITIGTHLLLSGLTSDCNTHIPCGVDRHDLGSLGGEVASESEVLLRFSLKECIYKALHPFLQRYVSFQEVSRDDTPPQTVEPGLRR